MAIMRGKIKWFALYLAILLISIVIVSGCIKVPIVIDGDTIKFSDAEIIRYLGIDTPEKGEPLFAEATALNRDLLEGRSIVLQRDKTDRDVYGRLLRYVFADSIFVNLKLVRQGLALAYREDKFVDNMYYTLFEQASNEAYDNGLGIWGLTQVHPKLAEESEDYYIPVNYPDIN